MRCPRARKSREPIKTVTQTTPLSLSPGIIFVSHRKANPFFKVSHLGPHTLQTYHVFPPCPVSNKILHLSFSCGFCLTKASLLRNLYTGQKATVRTGHGPTDWLQIGKGVHQGCILSPCLLNLYSEYIMRKAGLEGAQARIKIAGRNINNLRCADDTTLWQKVKKN